MREFKVLAVVVFFTVLIYWGVEPFAHSQMHPHVAPADLHLKIWAVAPKWAIQK